MANGEKPTPKTIAAINFKGGVGKTTMTWCLGDYLSTHKDENIILFDLDAQMSLTQAIAFNEDNARDSRFTKWEQHSRDMKKSISDAFLKYMKDGGTFNFDIDADFIYKISEQYHFVPCNENFYLVDLLERRQVQWFMRDLLKKITQTKIVSSVYTYALFDCPPSFTALSYSILSCCDVILVPINPDIYAVRGISILLQTLGTLQKMCQDFSVPNIAVFMNKAKKINGGLTKDSKRYWDDITNICTKTAIETGMRIRCLNSSICERAAIKKAVTGRRGIPSEFMHDFQDLWNNIEEFIHE
jgi:chromosome partitioning protein